MLSVRAIGLVFAASAVGLLPAQQPVFRTGTDYVQLDVVVTDGNGKAIQGLTKADFEITERGRAQKVEDVEFIAIPPSRRTSREVTTTGPTIDVVTNRHAPTARQWVVVIDDLHIIELHLRQTKQVVQELLESLSPDDQVAIVFVGRSDLSQGFTSDLDAQMRTVGRIKDALGFACDAANICGSTILPPPSETTPKLPTTPPPPTASTDPLVPHIDAAQRDRHRYALATIEVLKNISTALVHSTYPRKALVYVSEGLTYSLENTFYAGSLDFSRDMADAKEVFDQLQLAFETARRGGVPVYSIDPRGLPDCTSIRGDCKELPWENIRAQMNHMRALAGNTGGLAFVGGADLTRSVHELVEDNSSFYVIGYHPQPFERDGKFHDVNVAVKRSGAHVRARAGYEAPKIDAQTAAETQQTLENALGAALPASGLMLRALAAPVAPGLHGMKTVVTLEVTYPVPLGGSTIADDLQVGMLALDHDGKSKGSVRQAFHFTGSPRGASEITYAINGVIELPSQPLTLRVAVASQALGRTGAVHLPVEPIKYTRDELQLGAVVLGIDGPPRQAAMPPGALEDLVPFQPTTARAFAATDTLRVFAPLFWVSGDGPVTVTLSICRGHDVVAVRRAHATAVSASSTHRQASVADTLPLAGVPAGQYLLEVEARLTSDQTAKRAISIEIR